MLCPECWRTYPHQHMTAMERLDRDDKVCGCGQIGCCEVKREAFAA